MAREREAHAQGNPDIAIEKQRKIQEETELAHQETEKVSAAWRRLSERNRNREEKKIGEFQITLYHPSQEKEAKKKLCLHLQAA